jgi:hypothetical protein
MLNFVRYSGTAAPSHRLLASDGRSSRPGDLMATTTRINEHRRQWLSGSRRTPNTLCQAVAKPSEVDDWRGIL